MSARILYVENGLGFGGATRCLRVMVRAAQRDGYDPFVAIAYHDPDLELLLPEDHLLDISPFRRWGATSEPPEQERGWIPTLGRRLAGSAKHLLDTVAKDAPLTRFLAGQMQALNIDLVHTNNGLLANRAEIEAAHRAGIAVIAHQRGWEWPGALSRTLARRTARIIAVSQAVQHDLARLGIARNQATVIYDGVDLERFNSCPARRAESRRRFGFTDQDMVIGFVATRLAWKGHDLFLQAMSEVCREAEHVRGLAVGEAPQNAEPLSPSPEELAERLGVADRLVWCGHLDDPASAYLACDLAVHASKQPEPFGLVVIEAMACGVPVVAAQAGGPTESIIDGQTGLLYRMGDTTALAGALQHLIDHPELRRRLGESARRNVAERFDERRSTKLLLDLYEDAAAAEHAPALGGQQWQ